MSVIDLINNRFSCRAFKPDPVDIQTVINILKAAKNSPSWGNTQPWEVFVASGDTLNKIRQGFIHNFEKGVSINPDSPGPETWPVVQQKRIQEFGKERFAIIGIEREDKLTRQKIVKQNFRFFEAPTVIYLCMDRALSGWSMFDMGAFAQSIMLSAQHYGLGSITAFMFCAYPELIRSELDIPQDLSILIGIAIGSIDGQHPENQIRTTKRPVHEVVKFKS